MVTKLIINSKLILLCFKNFGNYFGNTCVKQEKICVEDFTKDDYSNTGRGVNAKKTQNYLKLAVNALHLCTIYA